MRAPDGLGRCRSCTFPADQLLYGRLCIGCASRCASCFGTGRERMVLRFRPGPHGHRYEMPRTALRRCQSCRGSGRSRWAA